MDRSNNFEKSKITKASTDKVVTNVYFDSFGIEKVRFQNANYNDKSTIDCYLDFEEVALLATDAASGRLFKELEEGQKTISIGGSKSSKAYNGAPESRIISLGMTEKTKDGKPVKTIFINMSSGKGKLGNNGQIMPDGQPTKKISVPVPIDKFRSMMIYTYDSVRAYLTPMVNKIVKEAEEDRKNYQANNQ